MGIGAGLVLIAIGAILTWALDPTYIGGLNLELVGVILMIVGAVGVLLSLFVVESWRAFPRRDRYVEY